MPTGQRVFLSLREQHLSVTRKFGRSFGIYAETPDRPVSGAEQLGDKLFVTNFSSADVTVVRRSDRKVLGTIPVGHGPLGASVTREGARLYVAVHNANAVVVIDTSNHEVIASIPTRAWPCAGHGHV